MMFPYYQKQTVINAKKQNHKFLALLILSLLITTTVFILSLIYVNDNNLLWLKIITAISLSATFCFAFYVIKDILVKNYRQNCHILKIIASDKSEVIQGKVIKIEPNVIIERDVVCDEITIKSLNGEIVLFLNQKSDCSLQVLSNYHFHYINRFIIEVVTDE